MKNLKIMFFMFMVNILFLILNFKSDAWGTIIISDSANIRYYYFFDESEYDIIKKKYPVSLQLSQYKFLNKLLSVSDNIYVFNYPKNSSDIEENKFFSPENVTQILHSDPKKNFVLKLEDILEKIINFNNDDNDKSKMENVN